MVKNSVARPARIPTSHRRSESMTLLRLGAPGGPAAAAGPAKATMPASTATIVTKMAMPAWRIRGRCEVRACSSLADTAGVGPAGTYRDHVGVTNHLLGSGSFEVRVVALPRPRSEEH